MTVASDVTPTLRDAIAREGLDTVAGAFAYGGGQALDKPNLGSRRRTRVTLTDADGATVELYLKRYGREGLKDRLKRMITWGPRRSPAGVEYENIVAAREASIPTMRAIACDEDMGVLSARRSMLLVSAVPGDALERCGEAFLARHAQDGAVDELTTKLANLVRTFHGCGFVHRDLYASHVFLDESNGIELALIDLARVFAPRWRAFRWRVKDLAQLKYSMPAEWVRENWRTFLGAYLGEGADTQAGRYHRAIDKKVHRMRRQHQRKLASRDNHRQ